MGVQPLHAGRGFAGVVEFAVVVVLEDPALVLPGPGDGGQPPLQRQGGAGRVLVGRGQEHRLGGWGGGEVLHLHALGIQWHGLADQAGGVKGLARTMVDRVFDQDAVTRVQQHLGAQAQRLLGAGQHQHLLGRGAGAALQVHIVGNGLAQRQHALCGAVLQRAVAVFLEHLALQPLPGRQWEVAGLGHPGDEGMRHRKVAYPPGGQHGLATLAQWRRCGQAGCCGACRQAPRLLGHLAAAAHAPGDEAFGVQLAVGRFHRIARHRQRLRQCTRGGQGPPGRQLAVEDQLPQAALQPGVQGQGLVGGIGHPGFDGFEQGVFEQLV